MILIVCPTTFGNESRKDVQERVVGSLEVVTVYPPVCDQHDRDLQDQSLKLIGRLACMYKAYKLVEERISPGFLNFRFSSEFHSHSRCWISFSTVLANGSMVWMNGADRKDGLPTPASPD
jgi:hypothetical protein